MKLKGIAAFSIILMALIVAPQAASDLREFLGCIAESAQIAFLHAVIDSRTGVTSRPEKAVSLKEHPTVCMNRAPSKVSPRIRGNRPLPAGNRISRANTVSVKVPANDEPQVELAAFDPGSIKVAGFQGLSSMDAVQLDAVSRIIKKTAVMSGDQRKPMSSDCLQRLIKAALMEKNRSTHQLLRPTGPVFKASRMLPKTLVPPPAVELPPVANAREVDVNEMKAISISDTHEVRLPSE
jgi:hypothetical protein